MTLDELAIPGVIAAAVVLFLLAVMSSRGRRGRRGDNQLLATVEAERDVMRANHAVEIAALEGRLAEAMKRAQAGGDTLFRLKAAESVAETATRQQQAQDLGRQQLSAQIAQLTAERDGLAERARQVAHLVAERDRARAESAELAEDLARLRSERDEANERHRRAGGETRGGEEARAEVQAVRAEAARQGAIAVELRREVETLKARLSDPGAGAGADMFQAGDALDAAWQAVGERDNTIAELRAAAGGDDGERLRAALAAAEERERAANDSLSRLAYDRDGLRGRLVSLERSESEAKAEVEKREALLELRLQKIYDLEARLRERGAELAAANGRLAAAEEAAAKGAPEEEDGRNADRLQRKLDKVREENGSLLDELEALRRRALEAGADDVAPGESGELEAARAEITRLAAENMRLAAAPRIGEGEIERLRAELRTLAERFVAQAEAAGPPPSAEPSLAERIRAFKAQRAGAPAS